jgi:hypothetical protein
MTVDLAILERLAEDLSVYETKVDDIDTLEPEGKRLAESLAAYRAAKAPKRSRAEVDAEIVGAIREAFARNALNRETLRENLRGLAREETAPEAEPAEIPLDIDFPDPDPCSCDEALALRRKLADIGMEMSLWRSLNKSATDALAAIRLILRGE